MEIKKLKKDLYRARMNKEETYLRERRMALWLPEDLRHIVYRTISRSWISRQKKKNRENLQKLIFSCRRQFLNIRFSVMFVEFQEDFNQIKGWEE